MAIKRTSGKRTIKATTSDGQWTVTRKTDHAYTHAVITVGHPTQDASRLVAAATFHQTRALAEKAMAKQIADDAHNLAYFLRNCPEFAFRYEQESREIVEVSEA